MSLRNIRGGSHFDELLQSYIDRSWLFTGAADNASQLLVPQSITLTTDMTTDARCGARNSPTHSALRSAQFDRVLGAANS